MKPSIYPVDSGRPGALFVMPKPSGEWLKDDIARYRSIGVDTIVSLLEQYEIEELSLCIEEDVCADNGIQFIHFPIRDRGLPAIQPFEDLLRILVDQLQAGRGVAVHCRAGIGRTGIVACCVVAGAGLSVRDRVSLVSRARGVEVPDTIEQFEFIELVLEGGPRDK